MCYSFIIKLNDFSLAVDPCQPTNVRTENFEAVSVHESVLKHMNDNNVKSRARARDWGNIRLSNFYSYYT